LVQIRENEKQAAILERTEVQDGAIIKRRLVAKPLITDGPAKPELKFQHQMQPLE
jgi:hypothetical protein